MSFLIHFDADYVNNLPIISSGTTIIAADGTVTPTIQGQFGKGCELGPESYLEFELDFEYGNPLAVQVWFSAELGLGSFGIGDTTGTYFALELVQNLTEVDLVLQHDGTTSVLVPSISIVAYQCLGFQLSNNEITVYLEGQGLGTIPLTSRAEDSKFLRIESHQGSFKIDELSVKNEDVWQQPNYIVPTEPASPPDYYASKVTQVQIVDLVGGLINSTVDLATLTSFKVQTIEQENIQKAPALFAFEKQVLSETAEANWSRLFLVQNQVAVQDSASGATNLYLINNQVGIQDEPPADPPKQLYTLQQILGQAVVYLTPPSIRSYSKLNGTGISVGSKYPMSAPILLQSNTRIGNTASTVGKPTIYRNPEDLRAGSLQWQLETIVGSTAIFVDPEAHRSNSKNVVAVQSIGTADLLENPELIKSPTHSLVLAQTTAIIEDYLQPALLQSFAQQRVVHNMVGIKKEFENPRAAQSPSRHVLAAGAIGTAVILEDPEAMRSTTTTGQVAQLVGSGHLFGDPELLQSRTQDTILSNTVGTVGVFNDPSLERGFTNQFALNGIVGKAKEFRDPAGLSITVLNYSSSVLYGTSAPYPDPDSIASGTKQYIAANIVGTVDDSYVDPKGLYEFPARHLACAVIVGEPWIMEPLGAASRPIVNVNYYYRYN